MTPFGGFLLVLLASRVALILRDAPQSNRQALALALAQCAALLAAAPSPALVPLALVILCANLAGAWLERRHPSLTGALRLGVLGVILLTAGFTFAPAAGVIPSPALLAAQHWLGHHFLFLPAAPIVPGQAGANSATLLVLIGALVVLHEANLLIRLILQMIRVVPRSRESDDFGSSAATDKASSPTALILPPLQPGAPPQHLDQREFNAGRFIGVLERLLVYGFVLQGQYAAIGLILAAKSFARFKEMDERDFAEYVLIGTLLSVSSAVLIGEGVKALLP